MPEMTETHTSGRKPKKKKNKESHNAVERHRKEKINAGINRIGNLLPCSQALKQSKNMILDQAFRYISELKKQNDAMLLEGGEKVQAEEIRRLRRQMEELRKESAHYIELLQAHDINILEDPTVHWKGKQRYTKVAKVTPTHQIPKGIIVYSKSNVMPPVVKDSNQGKQPSETIVLQAPVDVGSGLRVNGTLLHVNNTPAATELNARPAISQSTPGLSVVEQCLIDKPAAVTSLPPSVSYITLQLPTVTTSNPQLLTPNVATIATIPPSLVNPIQMETPVSSLTTLMQTVTTDIAQDSARTLSYAFPNNQALLQTGASGSTQTTWTTLQMAGNTVQPVCQSLPSLEVGSTTHTVQQVTVCPAVNKPSVQPIQIQMQSQIPVQQTSLACPTFQRSPPLRSTILNQTQAILAPQPRCAVLPPQATIVSQPQIVAHPTIVSQTQSSVFQPGSLIPCPPTAIIPQAKAPTPTTLVPQPQASVLPLLQTMHVLQVNPAVATPSGDTVGQPTNNPNVVILQQANPCPAQSLIREEVINKTPCQHIVIIQAPNQSAPAAPNPQVGMVPVALPSSTTQVPTTSISTTTLQSVGGKQLVHILPRPAQPQVNKPVSQAPTVSTAQTAPQTITVNGQLFSLQPLKTSDKTSSQGGQSTLQLVQPITSEEPTTNMALNSLGALSSLNQSISHGLSLSITSQNTGPSASSLVQQIQPPDPSSGPSTFSSLPVGQIHVPCVGLAKLGASVPGKKPRAAGSSKRTVSKKLNPSKKKELGHVPSTVTIPSAAETTPQKTLEHPLTCDNTTDPTLTSVSDNQNTHKLVLCNASSEASQSNPQTNTSDNAAHSDGCNVSSSSEATTVNASTVRAASSKPLSEMVSGTDSKSVVTAVACSAASKLLNPEVQPTASIETSMAPSRCPSTVVSRHNRLVVFPVGITDPPFKQTPVTTAFPTPVCTTVATKVTSVQTPQQQQKPTKSSSQDLVISSSTSNENPSSLGTCQRSPVGTETNAAIVGRDTTNRSVSQHDVSASSVCPSAEVKALHTPVLNREALQEKSSTTAAEKGVMVSAADTLPSKDFVLSQQVYTNLDDPTGEHSLTSDRHADSPSMLGAGGRGFSVASMLPQGNIPAASASFGSFTFTSEQAEMLALAMLEQDSPGKRGGACSSESSTLTNSATTTWASTKTSVCASKEKGSSTNHPKACKPSETVTAKPAVSASVRGAGEGSGGLPSGGRHLQNSSHLISYSQAQVHTQSSCAASLSVNNLIKSSSNQKPYLTSSSLVGQQPSVAPPVGTSAHLSQPSSIVLSSCPSAALLNEYTHGKTSLLRAQAERQGKIIPKRQGQDEVMLNTAKRHKPCPPTGPPSGHMDVKVSEHNQLMAGPGVQTSSPLMPRTTVEGGGALFPNTFMSTVVQSVDSHCPSLEQIPPGQSHIPQGHPQHSAPQPAQHLGGNLYMKQHHEQQRHHLYHLQHHLMQPDTAHRHSLHQRALQQQQQQEQHVQKKRGMVRGGQSASPAGMQQKQHHLEKPVVQQQHSHQQQSQLQQHPQQSHPQPSHQQQTQHTQPHAQPHQQQTHPLPSQPQHQQHQQLQQQQQQQQGSHSRHQQHQQQVQQHFRHQEKNCEGQSAGPRSHHNTHMGQPDGHKPAQDPNTMQRMMSSRTREQQLISPPSNPVSRSSDPTCATSRQERHRVSNYSAEALIGKSSTSGEQQQRMGLHLQVGRGTTQEQADMRGYLDSSRVKANLAHNPQNHAAPADIQRVTECLPFKSMGGGPGAHQLGGFETQVSRGSDMTPKAGPSSQRGPQGQQQGGFRMGTQADGRNRGCYISSQGVQAAPAVLREQEACQSFMQTLLSPHLQEQSNHQRVVQCCPPVNMEYNCVPGSSSVDIQVKSSSPSVPQTQKASSMRLEGNKGHISQVNSNMHSGVRASLPHPSTPHSSSEPGRSSAPSRLPAAAGQHSRQLSRDTQSTKLRPGDRPRPGTLRPIHQFESEGHLPLPSGGGVLLSRPQSGGDGRRSTIVRFMADGGQVSADNNLVPDQHLAQNFGFPFIPEGGMNPSINANSSFIPPVSQSNSSRTPSLLPVEAQNTLPSFYPSYSPAAHPSLPSDVTLQYFPNQMFTSPSSEKGSAPPLNNRFGSILSPPRPVGFAQASFPLLPEMPPMPITNSSGITPHISNFSLTSLFPEIATGMPTDGSSMPMSPLLSLSNSTSDSGKQPNRPAHNISHILGHDGSSAV